MLRLEATAVCRMTLQRSGAFRARGRRRARSRTTCPRHRFAHHVVMARSDEKLRPALELPPGIVGGSVIGRGGDPHLGLMKAARTSSTRVRKLRNGQRQIRSLAIPKCHRRFATGRRTIGESCSRSLTISVMAMLRDPPQLSYPPTVCMKTLASCCSRTFGRCSRS
jgi:hypothetical protein